MARLQTRLTPTGQLQLSRTVLAGLAILVLLSGVLLVYAQRRMPSLSSLLARKEPEPLRKVDLPEVLKQPVRPYVELTAPTPPVPVAQPVPRLVAPMVAPPSPPPPPPPAPPVQAQATPDPAWFKQYLEQQQQVNRAATHQAQAPQGQAVQEKKGRTPWIITPTDITLKHSGSDPKEGKESQAGKEEKKGVAQSGEASRLITPAVWARPAEPWKTLYMSQQLTGRTVDGVNSDEPGLLRVELTIPVFAKEYDYEILPKGAIAILRQEGRPNFGASTLAMKLIQIEPPGWRGEVISFKGSAGDAEGAPGLRGRTNNHYGKLLLATGINALVSLGSNALAGTPTGFYGNPAQTAARETSQSVSGDIKSLTQAQLKVPPTITKKKGEIVTIQLEENVTFSRKPLVVR